MKKVFGKLTTLLVLLVVVLAISYLGVIRQISCSLENNPAVEIKVCSQLQELVGTRLLFRDFYQDGQLAELLYVDETKEIYDIAKISKSLDGSVVFVLTDRPPTYRIERDGQLFLVTATGSFRENNDQVRVPLVRMESLIYEEKQAITHRFLSEFLIGLKEDQKKVENILVISENRIEVTVAGFPTILVELQQNPQQAASRLRIVLTQLNPDEIDLALQEIDLRFELPVLRTYESSEAGQTLIDSQE